MRVLCSDDSGAVFTVNAEKEWRGPAGAYALETGEVYVSQSPEGAEARIPVSYMRPSNERSELIFLTGAEIDEEKTRVRDGMPSITDFRASEKDSI